jgi:hypothetical protein
MMKKLFILLAVLAMTSVSQAAVIDIVISSLDGAPIDPVTEITILPSQVINMDIIYTQEQSPTLLGLDSIVNAEGPGTLNVSDLTWPYDEGFNRTIEYVAGKSYNVSTGSFGGIGGTGTIMVDHVLLHCDDLGDVVVWMSPDTAGGGSIYTTGMPYDGTWGAGVIVHQVPEPMTIALLGLGGLALLRRRK